MKVRASTKVSSPRSEITGRSVSGAPTQIA
jgi:hypothetical protein